jgi:uncharacterized protein YjiS (DUF1127 family)
MLLGVTKMSTLCTECTANHVVARPHAMATTARLVAGLKSAVLWPLRVLEARRELEMLAQMSEYELKDIGLTRSDLADATALPADARPTDFLAARVEERLNGKLS